jgi:vesicle transport through interaction with t-SNAREs 1
MSQGIFQAYDDEFKSLAQSISKVVTNGSNGEDGISGISMVEALMGQSSDLIKQMEMEARSHDGPTRKVLAEKVLHYKKSLASQQQEFKNQKNKQALFDDNGNGNTDGDRSTQERSRLLTANDKLSRQNVIIQQAQRTIFETEEVGADIVIELGRNRESIESAHDRIREFGGVADMARRTISSMTQRETQHRFLINALYFSLFVACIAGLYYVWSG